MSKESRVKIPLGPDNDIMSRWMWVQPILSTKDVTLQGDKKYALEGKVGSTIACSMSKMIMDPANAKKLGHPALLAHTTKRREIIVTKPGTVCRRGERQRNVRVGQAVCYWLNGPVPDIVDLNDTGVLKKSPELMDREFTLRAMRKYGSRDKGSKAASKKLTGKPRAAKVAKAKVAKSSKTAAKKKTAGTRPRFAPRGALKRAAAAGFVNGAAA